MFTKFRLQNYRTHIDTTIELKDLTLVIGSNNAGKSNLLSGINFFSKLVSRSFPGRGENRGHVWGSDYFAHKHSSSTDQDPIVFLCIWEKDDKRVQYELQLYCENRYTNTIGCIENFKIKSHGTTSQLEHGKTEFSSIMRLREIIESTSQIPDYQVKVAEVFFRDLSFIYYYNFQPAFLKGEAFGIKYVNGTPSPVSKKDYLQDFEKHTKKPNIASEIGKEGGNFQELIKYVKKHEQETYNRFSGYLKRFVKSFNGILVDEKGHVKWQFDYGKSFPYFDPDKISEGLIKAGAVALLCAIYRPPSMILIEEVENGINQRNLHEFLSWLRDTSTNNHQTQFIITSHSPSVIREFAHELDTVYNVHLREKDYCSLVTNLNDAIRPLVNMGTIEEEAIIERDGKEVVQLKPYELTELFYNGVLGEL